MKSNSTSPNDKKIGKELEKIRKAKGLKASWVAAQLGFDGSYICNLEAGKRHWRPELITNYLRALGLEMTVIDENSEMPIDVRRAIKAVLASRAA